MKRQLALATTIHILITSFCRSFTAKYNTQVKVILERMLLATFPFRC